ncbi:MAG: transposase [Gemmataceae bacterium]
MLCPFCGEPARRFGMNRNGSQRHRCNPCRKKFTDSSTRPTDNRCLAADRAVICLRMLLEGNSIRSTERLTGVHRDTIIGVLVDVGQRCESFLERTVQEVPATDVQAEKSGGSSGARNERASNCMGSQAVFGPTEFAGL